MCSTLVLQITASLYIYTSQDDKSTTCTCRVYLLTLHVNVLTFTCLFPWAPGQGIPLFPRSGGGSRGNLVGVGVAGRSPASSPRKLRMRSACVGLESSTKDSAALLTSAGPRRGGVLPRGVLRRGGVFARDGAAALKGSSSTSTCTLSMSKNDSSSAS